MEKIVIGPTIFARGPHSVLDRANLCIAGGLEVVETLPLAFKGALNQPGYGAL